MAGFIRELEAITGPLPDDRQPLIEDLVKRQIESMSELVAVQRLTQDVRTAAAVMGRAEVRNLVDTYYTIQDARIAVQGQIREMVDDARDAAAAAVAAGQEPVPGEPHAVLDYFFVNFQRLEGQAKAALDIWGRGDRVATWAQSIVGIGPVLSAGLSAHIDVRNGGKAAPRDAKGRVPKDYKPGQGGPIHTVGHIWRFAGLDPTTKWEKGVSRPWNAKLKALCWKIGQSFIKFQNHKDDVYGQLYAEHRAMEDKRNEAGGFAEQAKRELESKNYRKTTEAYKHYSAGRLPDAHMLARSQRWVVKLFLSHWHWVAYRYEFGIDPPKPYVLEHLGHADLMRPPNFPF